MVTIMAQTTISVLELFHADNFVRRSQVIGENCPALLIPTTTMSDGKKDLIVVAPTIKECRTDRWLEQAAEVVVRDLAPDGVVYLLLPYLWRLQFVTLLQRHGFQFRTPILHIPNFKVSRYLVPLEHYPIKYALLRIIPTRSWRRILALIALSIPGGTVLFMSLLSAVGLIGQRLGARSFSDWLICESGAPDERSNAIISTSFHGQLRTAILHTFTAHEQQPSAVIKLALEDAFAQRIVVEAAIMQRLRPSVERSGASMARMELRAMPDGRPVLRQTALRGQPLALLLGAQPARMNEIIVRVAGWLERWSQDTAQPRTLDFALLEREVLVPLAQLPLLPNHAPYHDWLVAYCEQLAGRTMQLVAAHNDLSVWNVLIDHTDLQIIDWEAARLAALPLTDFVYAVVHITSAVDGYSDRLAAFHTCFTVNSTHATRVARLVGQLCRALGLEQDFAQICFHACWLHHAAHEHSQRDGLEPGPFEQIASWLAQHPDYQLELG